MPDRGPSRSRGLMSMARWARILGKGTNQGWLDSVGSGLVVTLVLYCDNAKIFSHKQLVLHVSMLVSDLKCTKKYNRNSLASLFIPVFVCCRCCNAMCKKILFSHATYTSCYTVQLKLDFWRKFSFFLSS